MDLDELMEQGRVDSVEHLRDLEGGRRELRVRGRLPVILSAALLGGALSVDLPQPAQRAEGGEPPEGEPSEAAAEETANRAEEIPTSGMATVRGIASSTGVDWYGTEMTRAALDSMKRQMDAGEVVYLPTHGEFEWHQTIGDVRSAEIAEGEVPTQADEGERAFILTAVSEVDLSHVRGRDLIRALRGKRNIGQSIGAWFTELTFVENLDGEIERILVNDLAMDHLAATRAPANHESTGLEEVRTKGVAAIRSLCPRAATQAAQRSEPPARPAVRGATPVASDPEGTVRFKDGVPFQNLSDRHVLGYTDHGDGTVSVLFEAEGDPEGEDDRSAPDTPPVAEASEPPAGATDDSPAARTGDTPNVEEIDMTEEQIAEIVERATRAAVTAALAARDGAGGDPGAGAGEDTPPEPATERERELLAELEQARSTLAAEQRASERLLDSPNVSRRASAYESPVVREVIAALDDNDMGPLVSLCKDQGQHPKLVRAVEHNRALKRVLGALEEGAEFEPAYEGKPIKKRDIKTALKVAFRSYRSGGGFSWLDENLRGSKWA